MGFGDCEWGRRKTEVSSGVVYRQSMCFQDGVRYF